MSGEHVIDYEEKTKKLAAIIQERDALIFRKRMIIKARENEIAEKKRKIIELRRERDWFKEEIEDMQEVCNKQKFIESWLIQNKEMQIQAFFNEDRLKFYVNKEVMIKEEKAEAIKAELAAKVNEAKAICFKSLEYQTLEKNRIACLKQQVASKVKQQEIRNAKKRIALKKEIKRKMFYAYYIQLAEEYVYEKKVLEYKELQQKIQATMIKLHNMKDMEKEIAKKVALKRKLEDDSFGDQSTPHEKPAQIIPDEEEYKDHSTKIKILENRTIRVPLQPPKPQLFSSVPESQIANRRSLLLRHWQKYVAKKNRKMNTSQLSQISQQSEQNLIVTNEADKLMFQSAGESKKELENEVANDLSENQNASELNGIRKIPVYGRPKQSDVLQELPNIVKNYKNSENIKPAKINNDVASQHSISGSQMKTTEGGHSSKKCSGETPKMVRFSMDQTPAFGQSMFMDMAKSFDKGATFTVTDNERASMGGGEVSGPSEMNFELSGFESGIDGPDMPEFSFDPQEGPQSAASIAPVQFRGGGAGGFFSFQNQTPFHF